MSFKSLLMATAGVGSCLALAPQVLAQAASTPADAPAKTTDHDIVVTGVRASFKSAQAIKSRASQIVDSIVATDIGKLPDQNVTDALQRVTGIQVERDYGEGATVQVRGLSQVETTLDGREIFSAQGTRGLNFQDIPSELLGGIDVYKTPSANLIEGGLGGTIDLRMRKPFDFKGLTMALNARALYSDLANKSSPLISGLVSDRWKLGSGEIGALVAVSYQDRRFRADIDSVGTPVSSTTIIPGQTVVAPSSAYNPNVVGDRKRFAIDSMIQWKPQPDLEIYIEDHYAKYDNTSDTLGPLVHTGAGPATNVTLFPGTQDVASATYLNAYEETLAYNYDTHDRVNQIAGGARFTTGKLDLHLDVAYTSATGSVIYNSAVTAAYIPQFTQDLRTNPPSADTHGYDLLSASNNLWEYTYLQANQNKANQFAVRLDGTYHVGSAWLSQIDVGARFSNRTAATTQLVSTVGGTFTPTSSDTSVLTANPVTNFFNDLGPNVPLFRQYLGVDPEQLRTNLAAVQQAFAGTAVTPTAQPGGAYHVGEKTTAIYAVARFADPSGLVDGNAGLRYIHTQEDLTGNELSSAGVSPIAVHSEYGNLLPSFNIRFNLTQQVKLRFAASKSVTRPDFSSLSPTVNLNSVQLNGTGGNPNLKPLKADQLDSSLEYYFAPTGSIYAAAFYKKVTNFLQTTTANETFNGVIYAVSLPANGADGTIKGIEAGYQQFFDFLPGPLSGLGAQANYTLIDSSTTGSIKGQTTPLQGLSKYSYNLIGIYEKYGFSARVAYNWRSTYFQSTFVFNNGVTSSVQPVFLHGYGWLNGSLSYDINPRTTISFEGINLTRTTRRWYFNNVPTRPNQVQIDDRQFLFGMRIKL